MKTINDIPCGHLKPLPRLYNPFEDRKLRKQIETANTKDDCIINVGNGYYRPVPGDPVDEKELDEYLSKAAPCKSDTEKTFKYENDI